VAPCRGRDDEGDGRSCARGVAPAEIERRWRDTFLEQQCIQEAPRRKRSVAAKLRTLQRFTCLPLIEGSSAMRFPEATRRIPSSISSMLAYGKRSLSKPPVTVKSSLRIAPMPAQNVVASPAPVA